MVVRRHWRACRTARLVCQPVLIAAEGAKLKGSEDAEIWRETPKDDPWLGTLDGGRRRRQIRESGTVVTRFRWVGGGRGGKGLGKK